MRTLERVDEVRPDVAPPAQPRPSRLRRFLTPLLLLNVIAMPILVPRGPGNSAPPDLVIIPFAVLAAAALWLSRSRIRLPLGASYLLIVLGGVVAVTQSIVPRRSAIAVVQDGYLVLWFLVVVNFLRDGTGRAVRLVAGTWAVVGTATALFTWLATFTYPANVPRLFGFAIVNPYGRSTASFEDPNYAGNYLVVSLLVLWASPWPRRRLVKLALTPVFLLGIWATQSITALAVLAAGVLVAALTTFVSGRSSRFAAALALAGAAILGATFLPSDIGTDPADLTRSLGGTKTFSASLGRTEQSLAPRMERIRDAFHYFGADIIIGIGPSATDETLFAARSPIGGELHSDYAAGFIERGVVGGLGVLCLFASAFAWAARTGTDRALRLAGWRPHALTGAVAAVLLAGISLETLHFRHVWLLFALVIALSMRGEPVLTTGTGSHVRT